MILEKMQWKVISIGSMVRFLQAQLIFELSKFSFFFYNKSVLFIVFYLEYFMSGIQQRAELQAQIWKIANEVRGAVDGWDFKQFVLGTLFYRFISENFSDYFEADDESIVYANLDDSVITQEIKDDAVKTKGYFIYPSQLFVNVAKNAYDNEALNTDLARIFSEIEKSAVGYDSEQNIKGLFADFDTTSNRLGNTVKEKNTRLAMHRQENVNKIYDPACGSGSLLLQAKKQFEENKIEDGFFGQEINHTTYNLARMNMFLHNINYSKFKISLGDTLINPQFRDDKPFDAIVSNPPYSINWIGSDDPTLINDDRFAPAGVLVPKSKADFAFILHSLSYLSSKGRAAIVCFPGIFYRGGAEQKIRKYLVDSNFVETVISLAPNLFYGTSIAVNILVLSKHKTDSKIQFIEAGELYKKETNNNVLTDEHINKIIEAFDSKKDIQYFAKSAELEEVAKNDYNLSVSSYVEAKDTREKIDIKELNSKIKEIVAKENALRTEIDKIVAEIDASAGSATN